MTEKDWNAEARHYLENERIHISRQRPPGSAIFVRWHDVTYAGSIQALVRDYSPEIVLLSKSSAPIPTELEQAIDKLQPGRIRLVASDKLDLEGRLHILRQAGITLTSLTTEQQKYLKGTSMTIVGENTGEIIKLSI